MDGDGDDSVDCGVDLHHVVVVGGVSRTTVTHVVTRSSVGAGLPAMQTPRCSRYTEVMLSQASQLPHF
ncbi:hypothetical protein EJ576_15370 [Pseudomonas sp. C 49-2]|nr:hypothetical protein EJ576_15370 [Pseudomonas sp. C 49-2]